MHKHINNVTVSLKLIGEYSCHVFEYCMLHSLGTEFTLLFISWKFSENIESLVSRTVPNTEHRRNEIDSIPNEQLFRTDRIQIVYTRLSWRLANEVSSRFKVIKRVGHMTIESRSSVHFRSRHFGGNWRSLAHGGSNLGPFRPHHNPKSYHMIVFVESYNLMTELISQTYQTLINIMEGVYIKILIKSYTPWKLNSR